MVKYWWLGVLCAGLGLIGLGASLERHPNIPANVVFILVDTLRADVLESERNGTPVAPFLRQFAGESVYFSDAVSPCSWTKPAMASLFTSLDVARHQVYFSGRNETPTHPVSDVLPDSLETMAEYLTGHGYDAWGFQTNANLTAQLGFAQGFGPDRYVFGNGARADAVTSQALGALPSLKPPFLMYVHYMDPHAPYEPPASQAGLFGPEPGLSETERSLIAPDRFIDYLVRREKAVQEGGGAPTLSTEGRETVRQRYAGEVRFTDDQVGVLVNALRREYPKTLFVVLSDHGEEFWEHEGLGHGNTAYDEQIRVPLLFHGPGLTARREAAAVTSLGVLPSIASYLGLPPNPVWQGQNLLGPGGLGAGPAFVRTRGSWQELGIDVEAVVDKGWKLVVDLARGQKALFDLGADPQEKQNLIARDPERAAQLETMLAQRNAQNERGQSARTAGSSVALDEQTVEQMEVLGYLKGDKKKRPPKNVVLIVVDTLRVDRLHASRNGQAVMPRMTEWAGGAWEFTGAVAQATWTKPSVVSILTGLYPATHHTEYGVQSKMIEGQNMTIDTIPDAIETAGEYFKRQGYATAAVQTNQHLKGEYGFGRDFDTYAMDAWQTAGPVTDHALRLLEGLSKPYFLYVHYFDPHATYDPPEPHRSAIGPVPALSAEDGELLSAQGYHQGYYLDKMLYDIGLRDTRLYGEFSEPGRAYVRQMYDGECRYVDTEARRLIDRVQGSGDTIVVFTSDHGEEFWEHGSIGHAKTVYQELAHVPLLIRAPGEAPAVVSEPVETIDILPTLAGLLKMAPNAQWQGRDLCAAGRGGALAPRPVFSATHGSIREAGLTLEMVISGQDKLIVDEKKGKAAVYHLGQDAGEVQDLSNDHPDKRQFLESLLAAHRAELGRHSYAQITEQPAALDDETRDRLKSMGYLGAEKKRPSTGVPLAP